MSAIRTITRTSMAVALAASLVLPTAAAGAQAIDPIPPLPCPWWDCNATGDVVVEEYRLEVLIEDGVATTRVTQVLRNDGLGIAEGEFLHPIPADAAITDLVLWIDGEPVSGEVLDADEARSTYQEIVRRTLDPALLEYVDHGLLKLSVFPIPAGGTRQVEIEYRQVVSPDAGLVRLSHPLGREHGPIDIESVVARIEIHDETGIKAVHSPTHAISVDRPSETSALIGFEGTGAQSTDLAVAYSTDPSAVSIDVLSYRDGEEGWFLLLASAGVVDDDTVTPKDVAIVLDVSGSMEGEKLAQAKQAADFVLDNLNSDDRFEVIAFSTGLDRYAWSLRDADDATGARSWVSSLVAGGATDIHGALDSAFSLAEPGRPLYVIFLTDGLPTEGLVDTAAILDSLRTKQSETTSIFSFGVGYDVDTILLDSIAADHHGTNQYVVPGEQIETAVSSLYAKVSSPVMTAVGLEIEGIDAWDMLPTPLPDLFSGGQLVLAGRFDGWGPATVTLTGRLAGESVTIQDEVRFTAAGGDDAVPGLWATRKIGSLLRDIRLNGPDEETIDQIVRISIRHGIVTPYTSYLVTEPAPFGADALDDIVERAAEAAAPVEPTGEASVLAADAAGDLAESEQAAAVQGEHGEVVMSVGARTFLLSEGVWIDTTYDPAMPVLRVAFGSDDYFRLVGSRSTIASALAVGPQVIVVAGDTAFEIVAPDAETDTLPSLVDILPEGTTTTLGEAVPGTEQLPPTIAIGSTEGEDDPAMTATVAIISALAAAAALALVAARRS